jgi:hypothetical protein
MERLYGLERVRLVMETADEEKLKRWLGHAASELLLENVEPGVRSPSDGAPRCAR